MQESQQKQCASCQQSFLIDQEDFLFYEKVHVPPPTFCPQCRKQRRLTWRNDTTLYSRTCDLCDKSVISIYSPESGMTVYCQKCWWSDNWDPAQYAKDYDFSRPFFEQFAELQRSVPILSTVNDNGIASVNCEYTHDFAFGKNCYMVLIAWKIEDCMYGMYLVGGKDCMDFLNSMGECQFTYETAVTEKCYQCRYVYYSATLSDCAFMYDCRDCTDCFMCVGLRHKQYCFKNEQYTKEEYEKIVAEYRLDTYTGVERAKREFQEIMYTKPRKFANLRNCVACTGDGLINGKNSKACFNVQRPEDCKWVENGDTPKDSYDLSVGGELNQCYEGITPDHSFHSFFSIFSWKNQEVAYVDGCHSSKYLFGCAGMRNGEYSILNKRYSKEEYEALREKIIKHMNDMPYADKHGIEYRYGEFFPTELSYFRYNESVAQDYFPLTRGQVEAQKWQWQDQLQMTIGKETVKPEDLPETIADVQDSILQETLACIHCRRNYRIVPVELEFYRKHTIPLPRVCFYCRHKARLAMRNPFNLWQRKCNCAGDMSDNGMCQNTTTHTHGSEHCPNEFETSYPPETPASVYCEQCYNAEIV